MSNRITFTLDGRQVSADPGETIWQVAAREGIDIPHLCYAPEPGYRPDGNCRACMVYVEGERVLAASCLRQPTEGMEVSTTAERAAKAREMVMEMLVADQPDRTTAPRSGFELLELGGPDGSYGKPFPRGRTPQGRSQPHRDGGQPGCLYPLQPCVCAPAVKCSRMT